MINWLGSGRNLLEELTRLLPGGTEKYYKKLQSEYILENPLKTSVWNPIAL
jgi:hypothetical protein